MQPPGQTHRDAQPPASGPAKRLQQPPGARLMDVTVSTRGDVAEGEKDHAGKRGGVLEQHVSDPVLGARVTLKLERNPRLTRPARAEAELNVNGHMLRGHVASATMSQAIDELAVHLERQLRDFVDRRAGLKRRDSEPGEGEWHHGQASPTRPSFDTKPVEERSIARRKTFALAAIDRKSTRLH